MRCSSVIDISYLWVGLLIVPSNPRPVVGVPHEKTVLPDMLTKLEAVRQR